MNVIEKIAKKIRASDRFLITAHINPEGDSLGSQLAMAALLESLGKNFIILNNDKVPLHYRFLPRAELIQQKGNKNDNKFNVALVLDCPNLNRTGNVKDSVKKAGFIINIDHHVSNEMFGNLNWVEKDVSSAGEMIYRLYKKMRCEITKEAALYLYIAILTDTGSFNYSNTSAATHKIVSELLGYGIKSYDVSQSIYENKSPGDIKLLGEALSDLKVVADGKIAYMVVRRELFKRTKTKPVSCENFVNFARSIRGVEVAVFFREDINKKNTFHASFRSGKKADVNKIA